MGGSSSHCHSFKAQSQGGGGWGVLQISSDGKVQRIFEIHNFGIFLRVRKFLQVFFIYVFVSISGSLEE